jgi:dihydrolipoamide dehydrogenase
MLGQKMEIDYSFVPSVVFTQPEIGCVGLTEEMAKDRGIRYDVSKVLFRSIGRSQTTGDISGEAKILFDINTKKILGIHIIGPQASELITAGCIILKKGGMLCDLKETIIAHPTLSEIYYEMGLKGLGYPLHG